MRLALASAAAGLAAAAVALRLWRQRRVVQQEAQDRLDQLEGLVSRQSQTLKQYEAALAELRSQTDSAESSRPVLYRIVLTGGPCAGKTTALADIKARLQSLGFAVLCVPEVATLLFGGGAPFPVDEVKPSSPLSHALRAPPPLTLQPSLIVHRRRGSPSRRISYVCSCR